MYDKAPEDIQQCMLVYGSDGGVQLPLLKVNRECLDHFVQYKGSRGGHKPCKGAPGNLSLRCLSVDPEEDSFVRRIQAYWEAAQCFLKLFRGDAFFESVKLTLNPSKPSGSTELLKQKFRHWTDIPSAF